MNVLQTGGVTPWIAILSMLAIVCLSTSCSSSSSRHSHGGAAMDWSRPPMNDAGTPVPAIQSTSPVIVYVPAPQVQPQAVPPAARPGANPMTAPAPMPPKPDSTASGLPAPIVDDLRQADVAPADREAFRIVPETMSTTKVYTVRKGDTLSSIARRFYGDTDAWKRIFAANRDVLPSEGEIAPGMTLRIP